jgi:hypothetical protein
MCLIKHEDLMAYEGASILNVDAGKEEWTASRPDHFPPVHCGQEDDQSQNRSDVVAMRKSLPYPVIESGSSGP